MSLVLRRFTPPSPGSWVAKATQLGFTFGRPKPREVKAPGSRGGRFWIDARGNIRYDDPPAGTRTHAALTPEVAEQLGAAAFRRGLHGAPALDPELTARLSPVPGENTAVLQAWTRGWTRANLAAPVPETPAPPPVLPPTATRPQGALIQPPITGEERARWPEHAKTYADGAEHWEVLEAEYVRRAVDAARKRLAGNIRYYEEHELPTLSPTRPLHQRKRAEFESHLRYWRSEIEKIDRGETQRYADKAREEYGKLVKTALSKGKPVPRPVIAQRPEFRTARDGRARYEKGWHTSFANRSLAVDSSLQVERGFKVKRQDGKAILPSQKQDIADGVAEVEAVIGPLADLMRQTDLTIAHTSGKHPFMKSNAGGLYQTGQVTISVGIDDILGRPIRALAHEMGHWLDFQAGKRAGLTATRSTGTWGAAKLRRSTSVADHDWWRGDSGLIAEARRQINDARTVAATLRERINAAETPEDKVRIERVKVALGPYWREPAEVWARLFEQYIATTRFAPLRPKLDELADAIREAHAAGDAARTASLLEERRQLLASIRAVATELPEYYEVRPGWWTRAQFAPFMPRIEAEIQRRITMLRDGAAAAPTPMPPATATGGTETPPTRPPRARRPMDLVRPEERRGYVDVKRPLVTGEWVQSQDPKDDSWRWTKVIDPDRAGWVRLDPGDESGAWTVGRGRVYARLTPEGSA